MTAKPNHYVDNEKFLQAIIRYKDACKAHREKTGDPTARPSNRDYEYIGSCILKIAQKLATAGNFGSYTWRDEMVQDGVIDCIKYLENFDENKYKNPFTYFTQICWYANLRRIALEKKQKTIKGSLILNSGILENFELSDKQIHDDSEYTAAFTDYLRQFLDSEEKPKEKSKFRKTTRAYQQKMKELEEKEKQYTEQVLGQVEQSDNDDDDDYDKGFDDSLFSDEDN